MKLDVKDNDEFETNEVPVWGGILESRTAIAGTLLAVTAGAWIFTQAEVVEIGFHPEKLSVLVAPTIATCLFLAAVFLLLMSKPITRKKQMVRRKIDPRGKLDASDDKQAGHAGTEQKPDAVQPHAPKRADDRTRDGDKGRNGKGSSSAPHVEKPGDGKPAEKNVPADT